MNVKGEINVLDKFKNNNVNLKFIIAHGNIKPIIGGDTCVKSGLIERVLSAENGAVPADWKTKIFKGLGCLKNSEYDIVTNL